ncbi:hypothetical protein CDAR_227051 [Caerostris darwini]|uniref:Uncharacterized protein n=1 Tax=Caerostris darwini TaxID=1538125 RepID=A0AAV4WI88_9ARAC|nr:hypothetical protein CDAR_227051 [Caerostris darwini]
MSTLPRRKTKSSTNNPEEKRKENQTRRSDGHTSRHRFSKRPEVILLKDTRIRIPFQTTERGTFTQTHHPQIQKGTSSCSNRNNHQNEWISQKERKKKSVVLWALFLAERQKVPQTTPRKRGRKIKQDARMGTLPDIGFPKGKSISRKQVSHLSWDLWMKGFAENSELLFSLGKNCINQCPGWQKKSLDETRRSLELNEIQVVEEAFH